MYVYVVEVCIDDCSLLFYNWCAPWSCISFEPGKFLHLFNLARLHKIYLHE